MKSELDHNTVDKSGRPADMVDSIQEAEKKAFSARSKPSSIELGTVAAVPIPADGADEWIDARLRDYPVPLVAKTVTLHNDPTCVHAARLQSQSLC
jgi:hypothetical protein